VIAFLVLRYIIATPTRRNRNPNHRNPLGAVRAFHEIAFIVILHFGAIPRKTPRSVTIYKEQAIQNIFAARAFDALDISWLHSSLAKERSGYGNFEQLSKGGLRLAAVLNDALK
jgi:hypothetical protein